MKSAALVKGCKVITGTRTQHTKMTGQTRKTYRFCARSVTRANTQNWLCLFWLEEERLSFLNPLLGHSLLPSARTYRPTLAFRPSFPFGHRCLLPSRHLGRRGGGSACRVSAFGLLRTASATRLPSLDVHPLLTKPLAEPAFHFLDTLLSEPRQVPPFFLYSLDAQAFA